MKKGNTLLERWVVIAKKADFYGIAERFGIDPVTARVIRNRDIVGDEAIREYLKADRSCFLDPCGLTDIEPAAQILKDRISFNRKIRVIGDYDIDGIMASYILKKGLLRLGADVDVRIPNRMTDGYGINEQMIEDAASEGVDTIVTCDNGISAVSAVSRAKELGMTVIITDHHEMGTELPPADAVIDPKRPDDHYGNSELCGAAVAWKLILSLGADPDMELLPFAAFATVGDIMSLTGENRAIVKEGILAIRSSGHPGLNALAQVSQMDLKKTEAGHIGFILGPCLNASGRLDSAMRALDLLEADSREEALKTAYELKELNDSRKSLTAKGEELAFRIVEENGYQKMKVIVLYLPDVHESIAGIIAGRVREQYARPAIVLTAGEQCVKGSGRSTENYSMYEELCRVSDLLIKFGGHPMAAGLSLEEKHIDELRRRLNENCTLMEEDLIPKIRIDVPMHIDYVTEALIRDLEKLAPYGKGNEKPVFADAHVFCDDLRLFGSERNYLRMRVWHMEECEDSDGKKTFFVRGNPLRAVCFRKGAELYQRVRENPHVSLIYEPQINEYNGMRSVQLLITHFK